MAAPTAVYQRADDNWSRSISISASVSTGTADSDYPASNLVDGTLWTPAKVTVAAGEASFVFDLGSAREVTVVSLGHLSECAALTSCKVQGNATDAWTSPSIDQTLTLPTTSEDGQRVCPWLDLSAVSPRSYRYWRLKFAGTNGTVIGLGEVWLSATKRTLARTYRAGFETVDDFTPIVHETEYGIRHVYERRVRRRRWEGALALSSSELASVRAWFRAARREVLSGLWVPDASVNDAWWVTWAREFRATSEYPELHALDVEFVEDVRGEPL
jgi:hypothetical protein